MKKHNLADLNDEQLLQLFQPTTCGSCGQQLHESKTGMRKVGDNTCLCSSCYFEALSQAIDDFPIGVPRTHR